MTSPARAVDIAKSIAFTDPEIFKTVDDLNAEESPRWRVEEMPGKGMGLVATRNIELGDHIMSTTASIMVDYNLFYDAPPGDILEMQVVAMDLLPDTHRRRILNLSTHDHASDYETQVNKVILTNSFNIDTIEFPSVKDESEDKTLYTVFPESTLLSKLPEEVQ